MRRWLLLIFVLAVGGVARAAEVIPPPPSQYVNDYAGVINNADSLNQQLEQFERTTSNQILVAIYPTMDSDSSIEDYTVRIANNWKTGQRAKNNGAILFVFIKQRKMFIQVGYGLEGALPDALCKRIIDEQIKPKFKNGDYSDGIAEGVAAMMLATSGEFIGNGRTDFRSHVHQIPPFLIFVIILVLFSLLRRATGYSTYGRRSHWYVGPTFFYGGWGGGSSWGGGGGGGGGGGYSGGGGSFGGGGAGGSW